VDVRAIRGKTLTFLAEWIASSVKLLFEPSKFIPPQGVTPPKGAALTSTTRKHIGFAATSVFVAVLIFQLVTRRFTGTPWDSVRESLPFSLLLVGTWVIWSILLALVIRIFGGTRPPITNIMFRFVLSQRSTCRASSSGRSLSWRLVTSG
jgi:hypothetical protein